MDQPSVNIDAAKYLENKAKGAISIALVPNSKTRAVAYIRQFDGSTGAELDPQMLPVNPRTLQEALKAMKSITDGINAILADLKALGIDITPPAQ